MPARKRRTSLLLAAALLLSLTSIQAHARQDPDRAEVTAVNGRVALASLMALADGRLATLADSLRMLAATPAAQSADRERIRCPLAQAGELNVGALNWFALPDGAPAPRAFFAWRPPNRLVFAISSRYLQCR